jgi:hypothetical protein
MDLARREEEGSAAAALLVLISSIGRCCPDPVLDLDLLGLASVVPAALLRSALAAPPVLSATLFTRTLSNSSENFGAPSTLYLRRAAGRGEERSTLGGCRKGSSWYTSLESSKRFILGAMMTADNIMEDY